jgi:hypothetical protein
MNSPAVLIGFSGCSLPLGEMPFLGGWSASGLRAGLTFPPAVSSVGAWTSLVTGLSPAQHGIFDFYRRQSPGSRQLRVLASRDLACETLWGALDRQGLKATILNYPVTFPAPKIEGQVMPGSWVSAKRLKLGCYPSDLYAELSALEGIDLNELTAEPLLRMLVHLMQTKPADLSVLLIRDQAPLDFAAIDRQLEQVIRAAAPNATILLISEPAGGALKSEPADGALLSEPAGGAEGFSINGWLAARGYLTWNSSANPDAFGGKVLETADLNRYAALIDWTKTQAWSPPRGNGIFLLRQDGVSDSGYEAFRGKLIGELSSVGAISRVWKQEDLFAGPFQELAPDLSIEWSGGAEGILLASGPAIKRGLPFTRMPLSSITPFLLNALGLEMPGDIEGRFPVEILDPAWVEAHPVLHASSNGNRGADKPLIDPKDEEEILRRLQGLGYIE